ncbi:hypothetical protein KY285_030978 [Solanum tuberosum]|nr:hypothetical protein KY285_030978 [Solanum tuberosum]
MKHTRVSDNRVTGHRLMSFLEGDIQTTVKASMGFTPQLEGWNLRDVHLSSMALQKLDPELLKIDAGPDTF